MSERTSIVNISGDHEETIVQLARHLGSNQIRRRVFNAIYGRGLRPRSKKQIMDAARISATGTNAQQVQNELDHLAKHHLIVRVDNVGLVKDGSRYLYQKDRAVRANKDRIVRFADNRKAAERVATKRRLIVPNSITIRSVTKRTLKKKKHLTVLYLVSNPNPSSQLRVDVEISKVQEAIRGSKFRDNVTVEYRPAANLNSLIDGLNDYRPQIVQFSGHGDESGIATDNAKITKPAAKFLSFDLLAKALAATDTPPQIVILNSCKSSGAKKSLLSGANPRTKVVISMRTSVTDIAATVFARRFYAAIAAGQSVSAAFEQGKVAVEVASISEVDTPELLCRTGINPATLILV